MAIKKDYAIRLQPDWAEELRGNTFIRGEQLRKNRLANTIIDIKLHFPFKLGINTESELVGRVVL